MTTITDEAEGSDDHSVYFLNTSKAVCRAEATCRKGTVVQAKDGARDGGTGKRR